MTCVARECGIAVVARDVTEALAAAGQVAATIRTQVFEP